MTDRLAEDVTALIVSLVRSMLAKQGVMGAIVRDDADLRSEGLIDSLGFVQLLTALELELGYPIDLAELDPEQLTNIRALAQHVAGLRARWRYGTAARR